MKRLLLAILLLSACCRPVGNHFEIKEFKQPSTTYRSMTFWSLNDSLRSDEMRRQLALFKEGGFGGAFFHSRPGLLTPYLSEEWFEMMKVGVEESRKLGLEAWFYDEDKWPSGFAGGIVPKQSDAFRARTLVRVPAGTPVNDADEILLDDGKYLYISHVDPWGQAWYNGTCWVDLMNPEMVKAFIDCTYQPYVDRFAGQKGVMGIFSDEPQVSPRTDLAEGDAFMPYSPWMEEAFEKRWGYPMRPHLASLVDTVGNWRQFRLHYYRTVGECMENAFSRQIGEYCESNGLQWTGHFNSEEMPVANMFNQGDLMTQYRHMQVPGIDALGLRFKTLHNAKVMTSVANQYGRKRRVCEIFGISGHNLSLEDRMWLTAWHTACGVNMFCPHLSHYTIKGVRKYDYPPTFSYQEPYWPYNHLYEDFAARMAYFATVGATVGEVCVLSTLESDYLERDVRRDYPEPGTARDVLLESTLQCLNTLHYNSDICDEQILADIGSVEEGRLRIGEMSYHTVILPNLLTIRPSTLGLLEEFASEGGNVLILGEFPSYVDGVPDSLGRLRDSGIQLSAGKLLEWLPANVPSAFSIEGKDAGKVWTHLRKVNGGYTLQLSNISRHGGARVKLNLGNVRHKALLNPVNGDALKIVSASDAPFELDMAPAQTWVLAFGDKPVCRHFDGVYDLPSEGMPLKTLDGPWICKRTAPNALPLDFASWSTDGGRSWHEAEPVLAIYERFQNHDARYDGPMLLRYSFKVESLPLNCSLVVEQPWIYKSISLNGSKLRFGEDWYTDRYFRMADVSGLLLEGTNEVLLSLDFRNPVPASYDALERYGTEIETIFLCGDFAVDGILAKYQPTETWRNRLKILNPKPMPARYEYGSFSIRPETEVTAPNLTIAGYPFYSGSFVCSGSFCMDDVDEGRCYKIAFPAIEAIAVDVKVNGKDLPTVFCSPWEADVTDAIRPGNNSVELTLTGSLRNLMGPYHCIGGEFNVMGPATFSGRHSWPNLEPGDNDWYEKRKTGNTRLWRDDYFCIPFGMMEMPVLIELN